VVDNKTKICKTVTGLQHITDTHNLNYKSIPAFVTRQTTFKQNFFALFFLLLSLFFTWQFTPYTKCYLYFLFSPFLKSATLTKNFFIFYFLVIFHWANYTLNKTFFREGKEAENGGENLSQKLGEPQLKTEGKLRPILIPDLGG